MMQSVKKLPTKERLIVNHKWGQVIVLNGFRTYNYPQSRVTDHRINLTLHSLAAVIAGDSLDDVIDPLIIEDQAVKLAAV